MKRNYRIAVFVPHKGCPNDCVFCNQRKITGQIEEMTAAKAKKFIDENLEYIEKSKPDDAYIEIAFFGGSFTAIDEEKQIELLELASEYVEAGRVDAIRCSTRPDAINETIIKRALSYHMTAIELGVQSADDMVLECCNRGHTFEDVEKAAKLIRESGIRLGLQMMTGLPGDTPSQCLETAHKIAALKPDCVRIYPTLVMEGTRLLEMYETGEYVPQTLEEAVENVAEIIPVFEENNIEIMRIGLQTTDNVNKDTVIGPYHAAFAELCYGRIERRKAEEYIVSYNLKDCILEVCAPKKMFSKILGHKRENANYFKRKYNIDIVLKENSEEKVVYNSERIYRKQIR